MSDLKNNLLHLLNSDVNNLPPLVTYLWVTLLAVWGGMLRYFQNIKAGIIERFTLKGILLEISTSAFSGLLTYFLCEAAGLSGPMTAALVGISGHMGSRILSEMSLALTRKIRAVLK